MNLALARQRSSITVRPSGATGDSGATWFWAALILGVGGIMVWDWTKGSFRMSKNPEDRWRLQRERLDSGGYTSSGQYFGRGAPLFAYDSPEGDSGHVRASSRKEAAKKLRLKFPDASFYGMKTPEAFAVKGDRVYVDDGYSRGHGTVTDVRGDTVGVRLDSGQWISVRDPSGISRA